MFFQYGREHGPRSNTCPHYPCSRAMNNGVWNDKNLVHCGRVHGWRLWHPRTRVVNTGACPHDPCTRPCSLGCHFRYSCSRPVNTARPLAAWVLTVAVRIFPVNMHGLAPDVLNVVFQVIIVNWYCIIIIIIFFNDKLTSATHYNTKYTSNNVELIVSKWKHGIFR